MPDYKKGKIYKLVCALTGDIYIGSSCQALYKRRHQHTKNTNTCSCSEFSNPQIYLIEDFPCERKEQLHARERHWIENTDCVNLRKPGRTSENNKKYVSSWKEDNPKYFKDYYYDNKQKILDKAKELTKNKYTCECGTVLSPINKKKHEKSQTHQNFVKNNP